MCYFVERYYACRTRSGGIVESEPVDDQFHYEHRLLVPCSTPLMVPNLGQEVNDQSVLPCHGTMDVKEEYYDHPCPECRGELHYLREQPIREEWRMFLDPQMNGHSYGDSGGHESERMRMATERAAESLAKMIYCWIDIHWATVARPGYPVDPAETPDLAREIMSTRYDMICLEQPSHGLPTAPFGCTVCPLNKRPYLPNMATALRRTLDQQTSVGHHLYIEASEHVSTQEQFKRRFGDDFDLHDHWEAIPNHVWIRNPYFEFILPDHRPDFDAGDRLERRESSFGLSSALVAFGKRIRRIKQWESSRTPQVLKYCEPFSEEIVASRRKALDAQIKSVLCQPTRQARSNAGMDWGWYISFVVLQKIADILAHDSGLVDYRIQLIMDHLLRRYQHKAAEHIIPDPKGRIQRPKFRFPHVDALFEFVNTNAVNISEAADPLYLLSLNWALLQQRDYEPEHSYPYWVGRVDEGDIVRTIKEWRERYGDVIRSMKARARVIDAHVVKYIPGLRTDRCCSCQGRKNLSRRRGAQLCEECQRRTGWEGKLEEFGDKTFLKNAEHVDSWDCYFCAEEFKKDEPPYDEPAEPIRCHGKHQGVIAGYRCLRKQLLTTGEPRTQLPWCPLCRGALCQWDQNVIDDNEKANVDYTMNPWVIDVRTGDYNWGWSRADGRILT